MILLSLLFGSISNRSDNEFLLLQLLLSLFLLSSFIVIIVMLRDNGPEGYYHCTATVKHRPIMPKRTSSPTSSSAMAERRRELGDFKAVGHFEAKF